MTDLERVRYERANGTIWYGVEEAILDAHLKEDADKLQSLDKLLTKAEAELARLRAENEALQHLYRDMPASEIARLREALEQVTANRDSLLLRVEETEDELAKVREDAAFLSQRHEVDEVRYTELLEAVKASCESQEGYDRLMQLIEENDG